MGFFLGQLLRNLPAILQAAAKAIAGTKTAKTAALCANLAVLSISVRKLRRAKFAASVRVMQQLDKESLVHLLNSDHLPLWIKFSDWERGQHLQSFVTLVWPTFNTMVCSIIKKEVEERLGRHGEFGRATFGKLSLGTQPPTILSMKGVPFRAEGENGKLAMAIDIQIAWNGVPNVALQLSGIPGAAVGVGTCHVKGLLRVELSPVLDELPFLAGCSVTLLSRPELDFDIRVLGGDVMSLPALGSWLRSSVMGIIQDKLVWPQNLSWNWGPKGDQAAEAGQAARNKEQQRRRQLPAPLGVLLVEVVAADLEPRRSTFLGRLKPVSSRVSLLLPAASDPGGAAAAPAAPERSSCSSARAVLQKGLTAVQPHTCQPLWEHTFPFVVSSSHQVVHLLLSHKRSMRGMPLVEGMVQALGADMPLGNADVAVTDILSEAAAQEHWAEQQKLCEAAKLELARAAAAEAVADGGTDSGSESDSDSMGSFESAIDEELPPMSPSPSTRSIAGAASGFAAAAAAVVAGMAAGEVREAPVGGRAGGRSWVRVDSSRSRHTHQATPPPPRSVGSFLERRSSGSVGSPARSLQQPPEGGEQLWRSASRSRALERGVVDGLLSRMASEASPALSRLPSWRRGGTTRSTSPDQSRGLLDLAALVQLESENPRPVPHWLSEEGVWLDVESANVLTLAGLLAQAEEPSANDGEALDSPRTEATEEEGGWMSRLQRYILGKEEGEEGEEFAPTQAPVAGKLKLRLRWQPVEQEVMPPPLQAELVQQREQQQQRQQQQRQQQQQQQEQQEQQLQEQVQAGSRLVDQPLQQDESLQPPPGAEYVSPPASARPSLQLQHSNSGTGSATVDAAKATTVPGSSATGTAVAAVAAAGGSTTPRQSSSPQAGAATTSAFAAATEFVPQQGVLAVRVAHTKLEYITDMSHPVLAVSIDRRPTPEQVEAGVALLGLSPARPATAPPSAAGSPDGGAAVPPPDSNTQAAASAGMASVTAAAVAAAGQAGNEALEEAQRWISVESTGGSRRGSLHWGQVFYIPTSLSEADCQEGRVMVELGEVASTARYALFGPALYSLDAYDSFAEDVNVMASAAVPLKGLLEKRRVSCKARLKDAAPGVGEAERLQVGDAAVQLGWFPLKQQSQLEHTGAAML